MLRYSLPFKNITRRAGRSLALVILSVFLSFSILAGTLSVSGLKSGLKSLETRLGADIMVVPYDATTKVNLSNIILQGALGYFYMPRRNMEKIAKMDGIEKISEQFYLATASSSCCSIQIQIIGFDPETDFTISPWIRTSYKEDLGYMQILVGHDLNLFPGDSLSFYGSPCTVAARLNQTGTYLDSSVYASEETIKTIIRSAQEKKLFNFGDVDPDQIVSCVLVDVAEDAVTEEVLNDINIHVKGVKAIQTKTFISDIGSGLSHIAGIIGGLVAAVWGLALVILVLAFTLTSNERKKEFAVLRALGASRLQLAMILIKEAVIVSAIGSVLGAALGTLAIELFAGQFEAALELPFLLPTGLSLAGIILGALLISVAAGSLACAFSAWKISKLDTALILRGDN